MLNIQSVKREPAVWFLAHFIYFKKDRYDIFAFSQKWWLLRTRAPYLSQSLPMQLQLALAWLTSWLGSLTARHKSDKSCDDQQRELRAACNQIQSPQKCYLTRRPWDYHHKRWAGNFPALSSLSLLALHKSKILSQHCTAKRTWHHHINTLSSVTYYVQTYFFSSIYMRLLSSFRLILLYL